MRLVWNRFAGIITTAVVVATTIAPSAPANLQAVGCEDQPVTAGVTSALDPVLNVNRITGTSGADVIVGTDGPDVIYGLQGQDLICGLGGDDIIYGGNGADRIFSQNGADTVFGGNGRDTIFAGGGNDTVKGGAHNDRINGGNGDDWLHGNAGSDRIRAGAGDDTCVQGGEGTSHLSCELDEQVNTAEPVVAEVLPEQLAFRTSCTQLDLVNFYRGQIGTESATLEDAERRLFDLVNETRAMCDLDPLATLAGAEAFAQQHSDDMLAFRLSGTGTFDEAPEFPWFGHSNLWARIAQDDPTDDIVRAGENVAFVSQGIDPVLVHVNLLSSGGHMCNIIHPGYDNLGLGYTYFAPNGDTGDGQIVAQIYAGDTEVEPTSGSLIVQEIFGEPAAGTLNCWG